MSNFGKEKLWPLLEKKFDSDSRRHSVCSENGAAPCTRCCIWKCGKSTCNDFMKLEYEEISNMQTDSISLKSILLFILMACAYVIQIVLFRKKTNEYIPFFQDNYQIDDLLTEYTMVCWRYQSIFFCLSIYILLFNWWHGNKTGHWLNIECADVITISNFKMSFISVISTSLMLFSTKFTSCGLILLFYNSGIIVNFLFYVKLKNAMKFLTFVLLLFDLLLLYTYSKISIIHMNSYIDDRMNLCYGIALSIVSSTIKIFLLNGRIEDKMKENSPMSLILIQNTNSCFISTFILLMIDSYQGNGSFELIVGWIMTYDGLVNILCCMGMLGLANSILTLVCSSYLKEYFLKMTKIIEIPLADLFGVLVFELYTIPNIDYSYSLIIFNFMTVLGLIECFNLFERKVIIY